MTFEKFLPSLFSRLLKKRFGARLRRIFSHPAVFALINLYCRRVQPFLRRFYPLFGATVMIGLTYECQCSCVHCGITACKDKHKPELSEAEVTGLIRQSAVLGAGSIYLFGGEPLLAHGLLRIVRVARDCGLGVILDSNGLLLEQKLVRELKEAGLNRIGISIDSADEAEHDRLRGVPGVWRAAVAAVRRCREAGLDVYLSTYATRENLIDGGLDRTIALGRSLDVRVRVLSPLRAGRWLKREDVALKTEDMERLRSRLGQDVYWEFIFHNHPTVKFICGSAAKTYFFISPYGDVQPCAYIPLSFGNIRTESLAAIVRQMWGSGMHSAMDSSLDCPMNSDRFRKVMGEAFPRQGAWPHIIDPVSLPRNS